MKIILFGSNGMLGNYVNKYLSQFYVVSCLDRTIFDIETAEWDKLEDIIHSISNNDDVVINCSGAIPQQKCNIRKYITLNTLFPHKLNEIVKKYDLKFIHITTDCVFSGTDGNYDETSKHDAQDIYGITKSLGEDKSICILRTSIIGEEIHNKNSLIEWVISQKNGEIDGYENILWNGVTCLQLAKIIGEVIHNNNYWYGVRHIFSPTTVSKYELCCYINDIYELNIIINKEYNHYKNMTISSIYDIDNFNIPIIRDQIFEQKNWVNYQS